MFLPGKRAISQLPSFHCWLLPQELALARREKNYRPSTSRSSRNSMLPSTTINFPGRLQEVISLPPRPSLEFHILENQRGKNIPRWVAGVLAFLTAITLSISQTTWSPNISGVKEGPANDVLSCFGAGSTIYDDEQKPVDGSSILKGLREKLDAGLGDGLIDRYRNLVTAAKDGWAKDEAKHKAVPLGAIIMGTGAKVRDHDLQYLRQICFEVGSDVPQFLTAVDNYKPGTPRNFGSSSCYTCGKTQQDTGKDPVKCDGCWMAWFYNKRCERRAWSVHKDDCDGSGALGL